ncbi:guanine deaminase [Reinekea marina]|uniref:Guanine deaminase n=1 Tax=Reinekea marina TaxID=1310421 RepID=A0ABV7WS90_9GAMM
MVKPLMLCGNILDFIGNPATMGEQAVRFFERGAVVIIDGKIAALGEESIIAPKYPDVEVKRYDQHLIVPGMIDTHVHFAQTEMIASYGEQLLEWLTEHAFPTEEKFADYEYAHKIANFFLDELVKNGTTTALVFGTVHPESVDAFFDAAKARNLRMIAGKVMMDRNCPEALQDTPEQSYLDSKTLIEKWHGVDRLQYAVTPRFAPTSTPDQLAAASALLQEFPSVYMHTHVSENLNECQWVSELFPEAQDYVGVYEEAGLLNKRSVLAHGIHLSDRELKCMHSHGTSVAHCPTSNLFIGSGLFNLKQMQAHEVEVGLGSDVGAGTSLSLLQTYNEAYKVQQLNGNKLSAFEGLYMATLGGARALDLEGTIGNFNIGCEADIAVLNYNATPIMQTRHAQAKTLHDKLFALMMLADDRAVTDTYIMGKAV